MRRALSHLALLGLVSTCESDAGDILVIRVAADPPGIADITQLVVSASDGQKRAEVTVDGLRMLMIPPARTVGLSIPKGTARVTVQVEALNAAGRSLAFGEASVAMPGAGLMLAVKLEAGPAPPRFSPAATIPPVTGGSRLEPITWTPATSDDGLPLAAGLTDSMLRFDCFWQTTVDGKYRCLPDAYRGALAYGDAQCRSLVTVVTASRCNLMADLPAYGTLLNTATCPTSRTIHRKGAALTGALYARNSADACVAAPALRADQKAYALEPVDPSMLVAAAVKPSGSGPVVPVFLEAEDGARQLLGWRSSGLNTDCQVAIAADGRTRCLPVPIATVGTFWADSNCSQPAARSTRSSCTGENAFVSSAATGICPGGTRISRAGTKQTNAFQRDAANACTPASLTSSDIYSLGADVAAESMDAASIGMSPGTKRLRPLTESTPGGTAIRAEYWDAKLRAICVPTVAADGRIRCLPRGTEPVRAFVEASCTGAEVALRRPEDCDHAFAEKENTICPIGKRIFPLSRQAYTAGLWTSETGSCVSVVPRSGIQAFVVGAEIPANAFVELRRSP